jgi:hypothetical protein
MSKVIGLSGLAGSGKDLFYQLLAQQLPNCKRFALADALKKEIYQTLLDLYGVDIFTCTREEKNLVRPMLVAHGMVRRTKSQGKHWTGLLQSQIEDYFSSSPDGIACVTDIRYDIYPEDEVFWLREKMGGKLVHISLFTEVDGKKVFVEPPNGEEAYNDPRIKAVADYKVVWPKLIGPDNLTPNWSDLNSYVTECINTIRNQV